MHAAAPRPCGSDVNGLLLGRQQSVHGCWHRLHVDLPNSIGEDVDDLLVWRGYDALAIDFDDPMSHADASSLSYSPSHEAADDSILHAETELVAKVRPPYEHCGHWGAPHDVELHSGLVL